MNQGRTAKRLLVGFCQMRHLLIQLICCCAVSASYAQAIKSASPGNLAGVRGVKLDFYCDAQLEPVARVRIAQVSKAYERKGFFRIGALPIIAMDDVSIEIADCDLAISALAKVENWLCSHDRHELELRHLKVRFGSSPTNLLESGRAVIVSAGEWQLTDQVRFSCGTNLWSAARATLQPSGPHAGQLTLNLAPALTTNFFLSAPQNPSKKSLR